MQAQETFSLSDPAEQAGAITPHDSTLLPRLTRAIYVGGNGDVTVLFPGGAVVTFTAVPIGTILPIRVARVNATATTATAMVALY